MRIDPNHSRSSTLATDILKDLDIFDRHALGSLAEGIYVIRQPHLAMRFKIGFVSATCVLPIQLYFAAITVVPCYFFAVLAVTIQPIYLVSKIRFNRNMGSMSKWTGKRIKWLPVFSGLFALLTALPLQRD